MDSGLFWWSIYKVYKCEISLYYGIETNVIVCVNYTLIKEIYIPE